MKRWLKRSKLVNKLFYLLVASIVGIVLGILSPADWKTGQSVIVKGPSCQAVLELKDSNLNTKCGIVKISVLSNEVILRAPEGVEIEISGSSYLPLSVENGISTFEIKPLKHSKIVGFILGFSITLYVFAEKFSYVMTSIIVMFLVSVFGILKPTSALSTLSSSVVFVILAGSAFEVIMRKTGLDKTLGDLILRYSKNRYTFLLSLILISSLLSAVMSNTAATYVMMPIVISVVDEGVGPFLLALVASTSIGGSLTLIGTPPNLVVSKFIEDFTGFKLDFAEWFRFGFPVWVLGIPVVFFLTLFFLRGNFVSLSEKRMKREMNIDQIKALIVILTTVMLWTFSRVNSGVVGLLSIVLFMLAGLMEHSDVKSLRWDLVFLLGGGLTLGKAMMESGYAQWIVGKMGRPNGDFELFVLMLALLGLGTVFSSHTSASALIGPTMIPLGMGIAHHFGIRPEVFGTLMAVMATLSVNMAIALPVSTPPSAVIFSSGKIDVKTLFVYGISFGFIMIFLIVFILKNAVWI